MACAGRAGACAGAAGPRRSRRSARRGRGSWAGRLADGAPGPERPAWPGRCGRAAGRPAPCGPGRPRRPAGSAAGAPGAIGPQGPKGDSAGPGVDRRGRGAPVHARGQAGDRAELGRNGPGGPAPAVVATRLRPSPRRPDDSGSTSSSDRSAPCSAANEFVELVERAAATGRHLRLEARLPLAAGTSDTTLATFAAGTTLAPGAFLLAGGSAYAGGAGGGRVRSRPVSRGRRRLGRRAATPSRALVDCLRLRHGRARCVGGSRRPGAGRRLSLAPPSGRPRHERQRGGLLRRHDPDAARGELDATGGRSTRGGLPGPAQRQALVTMDPWPSPPRRSSMRGSCARTSRSSSRRSTGSRSPTSTRPYLAEAAAGAGRDDATSTRRRTATSIAASTRPPSARRRRSWTRARRCRRS